ncbi:MAG: UrcA family protein [Halioglobus sp.]|jgi:UrcA family protein
MNLSTVSNLVCAAVFAGATCLASASAEAGGNVGVTSSGLRTITVSYSDLDMADAKAQKILHHRLSRAAEQVCGSSQRRDVGSLSRATKNKECFDRAMSGALRYVSSAQLAAVDK